MAEEPRVKLVGPDGTTGSAPASQVPTLLKQGFKQAPDAAPPTQSDEPGERVPVIIAGVRGTMPKKNAELEIKAGRAKLAPPPMSKLESYVSGVTEGGLNSWNDEIGGAQAALGDAILGKGGFGEKYVEHRDRIRAHTKQAKEDNPWTHAYGNVGGASIPMIASMGTAAGPRAGAAVTTNLAELAPSVLRRYLTTVGKSGGTGLAIGLLSGLGAGEGDGANQGASTAIGGLLGLGLGMAIPGVGIPVVGGAKKLWGKLASGAGRVPVVEPPSTNLATMAPEPPPVVPPAPPAPPAPPPRLPAPPPVVGARPPAFRPPPHQMPPAAPPPVVPPRPQVPQFRPPAQPAPPPPTVQQPLAGPIGQPPLTSNPIQPPPPQAPLGVPRVENFLDRESPQVIADRQVLQSIGETGRTLEQVEQDLVEAQRLGYGDVNLTDVTIRHGNAVPRRMMGAFRRPGENQSRLSHALVERSQTAGDRAIGNLHIATDVPSVGAEAARDNFIAQARNLSRAPYQEAFAATPVVNDPAINQLLRRSQFRDAWRNAQQYSERVDGVVLPDIFNENGNFNRALSLEDLHQMKSGMGRWLWGQQHHPMERTDPHQLAGLRHVLGEFNGRLRQISPRYARANDIFRGEMEMSEAVEAGRKFIEDTPYEIAQALRDVHNTPALRQTYLLGVVDRIRSNINSRAPGADAWNIILGNRTKQDQLARLFPSREQYQHFFNQMEQEHAQAMTHRMGSGGSITGEVVAAMNDNDWNMGSIADLAKGGKMGLAQKAIAAAERQIGRQVASEVTSLTLDPLRLVLPRLKAAQQRLQIEAARRTGPTPAVTGGMMGNLSGQAGGLLSPK